ncbi:MAG: FMN-binding protein [Ilumatobacteraceae bacterium]
MTMSLASTGGLAALFAFGPTQSNQVAGAAVVRTGAGAGAGAAAPVTAPAVLPTNAAPSTGRCLPRRLHLRTLPCGHRGAGRRDAYCPGSGDRCTDHRCADDASPTTLPPQPVVVDGAVYQNKWGNVQVEVTFAGDGSLMDVTPLQTPNNRNKSVQINNYAVPRLTTEALSVQSAQVHTISGATYTSNDYRRSLQSAIDAARAAGITTLA